MKKTFICAIFLFFSCSQDQNIPEISQPKTEIDSLIQRSNVALENSNEIQKASDSVSAVTIEKVIYKIQYLDREVEKFKTERVQLLNQLIQTKTIVRVDTIYVETKKNFWGRERKNISIKSDSTQSIDIDSSQSEEKILDSLTNDYQ